MDTVKTVGLLQSVIAPTRQIEQEKPAETIGEPLPIREANENSAKNDLRETIAKRRDEARAVVDRFLSDLTVATTRLRINENRDAGVFVYQSIDRLSGEVIQQYPSDEQVRQLAYYKELAGGKVDSRA